MVRSQASPPTSPLPQILDDIATMLPFPKKSYRALDDASAPLSSLDPDTSKLLPAQKRTHHVWIQGKLAPVKTALIPRSRKDNTKSTVLLVPAAPASPGASSRGTSPASSRFADGATQIRRRSFDDAYNVDDGRKEEERRDEARRNCQPRGYGIGGAGNISESDHAYSAQVGALLTGLGRPIDVIHGPLRQKSFQGGTDTPQSSSSESVGSDAPSSLRQFLGLVPDRKGKARGG
ncbi:hypothetical protein HJFPF1_09862 [Paramyrothecium foliicola]|nr:hypothetical protein HJFPF1_09862 [Paramyrothecium foliicola]